MKILVTGANGQLGTELKLHLDPIFHDDVDYTDIDTLDLTDVEAVKKKVRIGSYSHIVNCAAYTNVDRAEQEPNLCNAANADAVKNIASVASEFGIKVIHISTDYVFDGKSCHPYRESDKVSPISQYGFSKRNGETLLLSLCPDAIILRTSWLYSPHGNNFMKTMLRKLAENRPFGVVTDQVGTPTSVIDLACAIVTILTAQQWRAGLYHFSNEGIASWYDFACMIARYSGYDPSVIKPLMTEEYPTLAKRPQYSVLDKTFFKKTYSYTIPHWVDALLEVLSRTNIQELK